MAIKRVACPFCQGEGVAGVVGDFRNCPRCDGDGSVDGGYVFSAHSWLYMPSREVWINPNQVAEVLRVKGGFGVYFVVEDADPLWIDHEEDVAAVTAWLEARS